MTPARQAESALCAALETEAGMELVRRLVSGFFTRSSPDSSLTIELEHRFGASPRERVDELSQEFLSFLYSDYLPMLEDWPEQVAGIINGQVTGFLRFALRRFCWQLKDSARRKENNQRGYLYRRIREIITGNQQFSVISHGNNRCYQYAGVAENSVFDPAVFTSLNYREWPAPQLDKGREELFTSKYLVKAAADFLEKIKKKTAPVQDKPLAVPFRETARWLAVHHPWVNRPLLEPLSEDISYPLPENNVEEQLDQRAALASISALAAQFCKGMDRDMCRVLVFRLDDPPLAFAEIARLLAMKDHNQPYRIWKNTETALQKFTSNWPGPPLSELPEEVGLAFIEYVKKMCKESLC